LSAGDVLVLGAGMSGLAAGLASGAPVLEAQGHPGGICASYALGRDGRFEGLAQPGADAYRFERGGGHWIWGGDPSVLELIGRFGELRAYSRRAAVHLPDRDLLVPYPLQAHLDALEADEAERARRELAAGGGRPATTLRDWLRAQFGDTLCDLFFEPFHDLYTAGLTGEIAPQDPAKSPSTTRPDGYNASFLYPANGLAAVAAGLAERCDVRYGAKVVRVDPGRRRVDLADGTYASYARLLSTLPLDDMLAMTGLDAGREPDPHTSVLVVNIGARRGPRCPDVHWAYLPRSNGGFHRVGFYSNVDEDFLPPAVRGRGSHVAAYVERAFRAGRRPSRPECEELAAAFCAELEDWGWIESPEVVDPTWIEVAYTWRRPGSTWREDGIAALAEHDIRQVGRYATWAESVREQSLARSIGDGLKAGAGVTASR
jgi:protoporphyrinogen oxidase